MDAIELLVPTLSPDLKLVEALRLLRLRHGRPSTALSPHVVAYVLASRSPDTIQSTDDQLRLYLRRCLERARDPFDPDDLAEFLAERCALDGLAFNTLRQTLSVVAGAADCLGIVPNPARDPWVLEVMRGIGRTHGRRPQHVEPLWSDDVRAMAIAARFEANRNVAARNIALISFLRGSGVRRKTVVDLQLCSVLSIDEQGLEYAPGPTKADQLAARPNKLVGRTGDALSCPVANLEALLSLRGSRPGALFPAMDRQGRVQLQRAPQGEVVAGLTRQQCYNIVVYYCGLIALPVEDFAVHSTRRGLGSEATANGVPEIETMNELGQASFDTFAEYVTTRRERAYTIAKRSGL